MTDAAHDASHDASHDAAHHRGSHGEDAHGPQPGHPHSGVARALNAVSLAFGRGAVATCVTDLALLTPADHVVDVGCGPGTAARVASRQCRRVTGVDPDPTSLRLARVLDSLRRRRNVQIVEGSAEALPLPDAGATVVWAISSVHHWADPTAGLSEALRVLEPGGRVFLVEQLKDSGARGNRAHGLTVAEVKGVLDQAKAAGFTAVRRETHVAGRRTVAVVRGSRPGAAGRETSPEL